MRKLSLFHQRLKPSIQNNKYITGLKILILATLISLGGTAPVVYADPYDEKINQLRQENNQSLANQRQLQSQEHDLSAVIADLQSNIANLERFIQDNRTKSAGLNQEITKAEAEIQEQRKLLAASLRQLYLDDQMTNLEKLASSKTIGDYVDKEQYRISVQNKIKTTMDRIGELKKQQEEQKATIEKLLKDQEGMQAELAAQRAESQRLLNLNQQQQAAYASDMRSNNSRIAQLQQQQAAENAKNRIGGVTGGGSGAGYPWVHHPFPNTIVDPWGMYTRQCVSYTAWRVATSGRHMPYWGGRGNANQWDDNARAAGIPVDGNPRVGDVAVSNSGYYGHVMYVEAVHGDGTITVSDFNSDWNGRYAQYRRYASGLVYIHF